MRNFIIQLAKKISNAEQKPVWNCGKNISMIRWQRWRRRSNAWRQPIKVGIWFHSLSLPTSVVAMAFSIAGAKSFLKMWEGPCWEGVWPSLDHVVGLRTTSRACALIGLHRMAAEGAETHGGTAVQEALDGTAMSTFGPKDSLHRRVRCTSTTMSAGLLKSSGRFGQRGGVALS